jgi:hypothetical protein
MNVEHISPTAAGQLPGTVVATVVAAAVAGAPVVASVVGAAALAGAEPSGDAMSSSLEHAATEVAPSNAATIRPGPRNDCGDLI